MKSILLFVPFIFITCLLSYGQGETCASAVVINGLPYNSPNEESTCGAGDNYNASHRCANNFMGNEDFIYAFTPAAGQTCITATAEPTGGFFDPAGSISLFVTADCPDSPNARCVGQAINTVNGVDAVVANLRVTPGITYYFHVTDQNDCVDFEFHLTASNGCNTPPQGFNCDFAEAIPTAPFNLNNTTCGRNTFMNQGNSCAEAINYYAGPAYFYSYKPEKDMCVQFKGTAINRNLRFSIHDTCPTFTNTTCLVSSIFNGTQSSLFSTLDSGKTYYFVISGTGCSQYDIDFIEISDEGSTCANAIEISTTNGYYENLGLSTQCKGDDIDQEFFCLTTQDYEDGNEIFFIYKSSGNECISAQVSNMSDFGAISMFNGCPSALNDSIYSFASSCLNIDPNQATIEYSISDPGIYYFAITGRHNPLEPSFLDKYKDFNFDFYFTTTKMSGGGAVCTNPDTINADGDLYEFLPGVSVQCKYDDYTTADICDLPFAEGSDYILTYTAPKDFCGTLVANNVQGTGGLTLMDNCPEAGGNCLTSAACENGCDSVYVNYTFQQGETYYLVVSSYDDFFYMDLTLRKQSDTDDGCPCLTSICESCKNSNFEFGDFGNWEGFTGNYANPKQNTGLQATYINDDLSRHTIMNAGGYDPVVGDSLLSTVGPLGDRYAVRIGNRSTGAQGDVLAYSFTVTNETKNFLYYYAVVFEDPSHTVDEQPFFSTKMIGVNPDGSEVDLTCADYEVRPNPSDTTFKQTFDHTRPNNPNTVIRWKDWTLVAVPLDNFVGQDVRIEFITKDCDRSGHFGYAYVDAFCGDLNLESETGYFEICPGIPLTLTAPTGFAKYRWSNGETTRIITVTEDGTYTVDMIPFSVANEEACKVTLETVVTYADDPTSEFDFDEGCIDEYIDFFNNSLGNGSSPVAFNYWNFGDGTGTYNDTDRTHTFPGPGTYDVELVVENTVGCLDTSIQTIEIPEFPFIPPPNTLDTIFICQLDSANLYCDDLGDLQYEWTGPNGFSSSESNPIVFADDATDQGMYYLKVIDDIDTCTYTFDSTYIKVVPLPDYSLTPDTTVCFSNRVKQLFASGGLTYNWSPSNILDDATIANPTAYPDTSITITVNTFHPVCPDSTMQMVLTIDTYEEPLSIPEVINICESDTLFIEAKGSPLEYVSWLTPDSVSFSDSILIRPAMADSMGGYYKVKTFLGEDEYCIYGFDSVLVNVIPKPDAGISPDSAFACSGEMVTFSAANPQVSMFWTNIDGDTIGTDPNIDILVNDQFYYVAYTNSTGCSNIDSVFADEVNIVQPDLGNDRVACFGASITITPFNISEIPSHYSYSWSDGSSGTSVTLTNSATLTLTVGDSGCFKTDMVNVVFQNPADFNIGNDTLLCNYDSLYLDFRGFGDSIVWNDNNTQFDRWIAAPGGLYEVTIYSGACVLIDDIFVDFENLIPTQLPQDSAICFGDTMRLTAFPPNQNYTWTQNGTNVSAAANFEISEAGNFEVILYANTAVCQSSDTMQVSVLSPNTLNFPDRLVCAGDSTLIDASIPFTGATYNWGDGYSGATRWLSAPGFYTIIVGAGPCIIYDTLEIKTDALPIFSLGADINICENTTTTLTADATQWDSYVWKDGTSGFSKTTNQAGQHILFSTEGICSFSDTINVFVDTIPVIDLGPDITICETDSTQLNTHVTNPTIQFLWNTGATTPTIVAKQVGNYSVTLTNGQCTYTDNIQLVHQNLVGIDLGPDQVLCLGDSVTIGFTETDATYLWNTGATTDSITVKTTDNYFLTLTKDLCTETDSVQINFDVLQKPDLGNDIVQCDSIFTQLDANTTAQQYLWNLNGNTFAPTGKIISISAPGTYVVEAIQGTCSDKDTIDVSIQYHPTLTLSPDSVLCQGESYTLHAFTDAQEPVYSWNTGSTVATTTVNSTNVYVLTLRDRVCTVSEAANIVFVPHPYIDMPPGATICEDQQITIGDFFNKPQNDTNRVSYFWNTGEDTANIVVNIAGRYVENVQIEHCFNADYFDLEIVQKPIPNMTPSFTTCANQLKPIETGLPHLRTFWNHGGGFGNQIIPASTGYYVATIHDGPCVVQDSVYIIVNPVPDEEIGNPMICPPDSVPISITSDSTIATWNGVTKNPMIGYAGDAFTLLLTNQFGCISEQTVKVIQDPNCPDFIYIPNAFSPDGDDINNVYKIFISEHVKLLDFQIFDRWGERIFITRGENKPWDGTWQGKLVTPDVYIWTINYLDQYEKPHKRTGTVTVLR